MRLTIKESARTVHVIKVKQKKIIKKFQESANHRREHLIKMRDLFDEGAVHMELDDPKSYRGYTLTEAQFITGEIDDTIYEDLKQNRELYGEQV